MQKDHPETPKLRHTRRNRSISMPELLNKTVADNASTNTRAVSSRHRTTMAPNDFLQKSNSLPRRRIATDRMSILPSQMQRDGPKALDDECKDIELLYDEYVQRIMTEVIVKKRVEERKNLILTQLATIAMERDCDEERLFKLKTRERDIVKLTAAQNEVDAQILDANNSTKSEDIKLMKDLLTQLCTLLQPLDVLRCNNIVLPETSEEWNDMQQALKTCVDNLKPIMEMIGTKGAAYVDIAEEMKEYLKTCNAVEDNQKCLEKTLCNLQVLLLKTASLSLAQNHDLSDS